MAFSFFRRRQKLVLIIMVLLMLAFLAPQAIRGLFRDRPQKVAIGDIGKDEVTYGMTSAAYGDLRLFRDTFGLGARRTLGRTGEEAYGAFLAMNRGRDAALTWVLLLYEAEKMGVTVTENQVEAFLAASGLVGETYQQEIANLRLSKSMYTEKQFRRAVSNYLMVVTAFEAVMLKTPVSISQLRHAFGDLKERVSLSVVGFDAEEFTADAPNPSDEEVLAWFEKYRSFAPQAPSNRTDFAFGYRQPNMIDVAWLFIDAAVVARAVEPSEQQMMDYWRLHKGELKKKVPVAPAAAVPAETQPAEPKFRQVVIKKYSQAKPQIRRILKDQAVQVKMNELVALASRVIRRDEKSPDPYSAAPGAMLGPAENLLKRPVAALPFTKAPLATVIRQLEEMAKVKIVYPFGLHGKISLDENVVIEVERWEKTTLADALERIGKKIDFPPIKWVACDGFKGVIFPVSPVNLVPISSGRTGMVDFDEIQKHELLGRATSSPDSAGSGTASQGLLPIAATSEVFGGQRRKTTSMIEPGGDYERAMFVSGDRRGRLLWRLVDAKATHTPAQLTGKIRRRIVADFKTAYGFKKAIAAAEAMKVELEKPDGDMEKLAKQANRRVVRSKSFARRIFNAYAGLMYPPGIGDMGLTDVFDAAVSPREPVPDLVKAAFSLAPADPAGPLTGRPVAVAPLPRQRKVLLIQRIGYEPVLEKDFKGLVVDKRFVQTRRTDKDGKPVIGYEIRDVTLSEILISWRRGRSLMAWFEGRNVARRVGYISRSPAGS